MKIEKRKIVFTYLGDGGFSAEVPKKEISLAQLVAIAKTIAEESKRKLDGEIKNEDLLDMLSSFTKEIKIGKEYIIDVKLDIEPFGIYTEVLNMDDFNIIERVFILINMHETIKLANKETEESYGNDFGFDEEEKPQGEGLS